MPALALDIGTYTLKAIVAKPGKQPVIQKVVEGPNAMGLSVPSDDTQAEKLAQVIDAFCNDHKLPRTSVRLSLPEAVISTKVISLPWLSDAELASAIGWQAEQHIPIPPEELSLEYQVLFRPQKNDRSQQMRVLLVGTRKQMVERYVAMCSLIGIEPEVVETQALSVLRSFQLTPEDPATLIVHIGASTMDSMVVNHGELVFVVSHATGGQMLTKTLENSVGLSADQAEEYKRTYGLDETQFQGKMRQALLSPVKALTVEMQKAVRFFASQYPGTPVSRVLISGGTAMLPGLVQEMAAQLSAEVLVAAPFAMATGEIPSVNNPAYSVCMGMLMRTE